MSARATSWALTQKTGQSTTKLVLLVLADVADGQGVSRYGQKRLAEMAEVTVRTLRTHLEKLENQGLLRRVRRHRENGSRTSDKYEILLPEDPSGSGGTYRKLTTTLPETDAPPRSTVGTTRTVREPTSDSPEPDTSPESEVFDYWRERRASAMGKTSGPQMQPTKGRMSKIRGRLAEGYSVDDLKAAVDGCLSRDFNVENGYTDISLICRSQEKVEQYLHAARNGNGRPSRAMSTQEWLEREGMTAEEYKRELEEFDW